MKKGKELKLIRINRDIKAKVLAERIGISNTYICLMEKENKPIPSHIYKKWVSALEMKNEMEMSN